MDDYDWAISKEELEEMYRKSDRRNLRAHPCGACGTKQVQIISDDEQKCRHCRNIEELLPEGSGTKFASETVSGGNNES